MREPGRAGLFCKSVSRKTQSVHALLSRSHCGPWFGVPHTLSSKFGFRPEMTGRIGIDSLGLGQTETEINRCGCSIDKRI